VDDVKHGRGSPGGLGCLRGEPVGAHVALGSCRRGIWSERGGGSSEGRRVDVRRRTGGGGHPGGGRSHAAVGRGAPRVARLAPTGRRQQQQGEEKTAPNPQPSHSAQHRTDAGVGTHGDRPLRPRLCGASSKQWRRKSRR
jgi:hypothetical protein